MGEARRRKQVDPNYGKPSLIKEMFQVYKELFRPRGREGEIALRWKIFDFYRTALEHDTPGATIFYSHQGLSGTDNLAGFTGTPIFLSSEFFTLETLVDAQIPKLPIEDIKHLAQETDFASNRITVMRICRGSDTSDMVNVISVEVLQQELEKEKNNLI